jgi:hypothetical protein
MGIMYAVFLLYSIGLHRMTIQRTIVLLLATMHWVARRCLFNGLLDLEEAIL